MGIAEAILRDVEVLNPPTGLGIDFGGENLPFECLEKSLSFKLIEQTFIEHGLDVRVNFLCDKLRGRPQAVQADTRRHRKLRGIIVIGLLEQRTVRLFEYFLIDVDGFFFVGHDLMKSFDEGL